ncbi:hypothetical protein PybrP1_010000 [[Pythium] brassicae (nom. inval.)]|nr:hypothetical protein PybrP1_010000 [[Pythium] brassicae (nom. inval.)]
MNVQAIADHCGVFRSLSIRPGSSNDQSVWNGSGGGRLRAGWDALGWRRQVQDLAASSDAIHRERGSGGREEETLQLHSLTHPHRDGASIRNVQEQVQNPERHTAAKLTRSRNCCRGHVCRPAQPFRCRWRLVREVIVIPSSKTQATTHRPTPQNLIRLCAICRACPNDTT